MDEVFRALSDPRRRLLLDRLFDQDGQTLGELCAHLPDMTRYGVMNHLKVLAEGGLVTTVRVGRSKYHYLNPVPIRLIHDRWITKFAEPVVGGLARLKADLEQTEGEISMNPPTLVYEAYINCEPQAVWNAIVDGDQTVQYFYGTRFESDLTPGAPLRYMSAGGPDSDPQVVADGEIIAVEAPNRLEMLFHPRWDAELEAEGAVRMVWLVDTVSGMTRVRVEYYDLNPASRTYRDFVDGIPYIVSGLKTLVETGRPLTPVEATG